MGQITATRNLVATKVVRHAGQRHVEILYKKSHDSVIKMETSALVAFCVGNSPVTGELPSQKPVTRSFDVFFDLCLNKRLSKQS